MIVNIYLFYALNPLLYIICFGGNPDISEDSMKLPSPNLASLFLLRIQDEIYYLVHISETWHSGVFLH